MLRYFLICCGVLGDTTNDHQADDSRDDAVNGESQSSNDINADEVTNKKGLEFAQVSQDMSELVYHLNSIQNDISELAGRPISLLKLEDQEK